MIKLVGFNISGIPEQRTTEDENGRVSKDRSEQRERTGTRKAGQDETEDPNSKKGKG
jgi:hypothetical protein